MQRYYFLFNLNFDFCDFYDCCDFCLNQDFNKIYKMNRINLANPDNLVKIVVQNKSGENIIKNQINQKNQSSDKNAINFFFLFVQRKKSKYFS